jgi:hypothetical protein
VEIFFSVVQRKVVSPNDFTELAQIGERLRAFEDRYNTTAQPFRWRFTTSDLDDLLARLDRHTADHQGESNPLSRWQDDQPRGTFGAHRHGPAGPANGGPSAQFCGPRAREREGWCSRAASRPTVYITPG